MRILCTALLVTASVLQAANTLTKKEIAEGWVLLYDGKSLDNWNKIGGAPWRVAGDGDMLALRGGDDGRIMHPREFKDFILKFEFQFPENGRSAVFLRAPAQGDPRETGYAVEINNNDPKYATGSLGGIAAARPAAPEPNKWHTFEIQASGDRIQVKLDGQSILDHRSNKSTSGHVGFQYYKDNKIEFRNIRVKPL